MQKTWWLLLVVLLSASAGVGLAEDKATNTPPQKLLTKETRRVIDAHKQIYDMSCIPMSVEMVLKLSGHAAPDFYELQNTWQTKTDGNFRDFDGKTIKGVTFKKQFGLPRDKNFPLEKLFATIDRELAA